MSEFDFRKLLVPAETPILQALKAIDTSSQQIVLVVDAAQRLIGTVTDGDVRRGLLRGVKLEEPVATVMNRSPRTISPGMSAAEMMNLMSRLRIHQLPVVDAEGRVVGLERLDELVKVPQDDSWVVLMAGGLGTRLRPLTEVMPKAMVPIGGRPLIETIIRNFVAQGFCNIVLSLNYKAEILRAYCGDGSQLGARIEYVEEKEPRGTAGALSLLPSIISGPFIVMNGDLITAAKFRQLLNFHRDHKVAATMCVRPYSFQVPYGVVETEQHRLLAVLEKPEHHFFVNAGIYVLDPSVLSLIPATGRFDMPDLFTQLMAQARDTAAFPLHEYWLDVGRSDDLERAKAEFASVFPP